MNPHSSETFKNKQSLEHGRHVEAAFDHVEPKELKCEEIAEISDQKMIGEVRGYILARGRERKVTAHEQKLDEVWTHHKEAELLLSSMPKSAGGGLIESMQYRYQRWSLETKLRTIEDYIIQASIEGLQLSGIETSLASVRNGVSSLHSLALRTHPYKQAA